MLPTLYTSCLERCDHPLSNHPYYVNITQLGFGFLCSVSFCFSRLSLLCRHYRLSSQRHSCGTRQLFSIIMQLCSETVAQPDLWSAAQQGTTRTTVTDGC